MRAITKSVLAVATILLAASLQAQTTDAKPLPAWATGPSIGFNLSEVGGDLSSGLTLTSPYFAGGRVAIRASANVAFGQGIQGGETEETWMPYGQYRLGVASTAGRVGGFVRLYGEGGVIYIHPNSDMSDDAQVGGYGLFGFEFLLSTGDKPKVSYFIELGGAGTGASAEKLVGKPIYANGFIISTGLRIHLR
jgi:hypothetical protein